MSFKACDVLLELIPALQVELLVRWLQLHDVAKLDSALCSSKHRFSFLKILDEEYCVFTHFLSDSDGRHLIWVMRRNVKISLLDLPFRFTNDQRLRLFQVTGKSLRTLITFNVNHTSNFVTEVSTLCTNLEKLVFPVHDFSEMNICSILCHLPRLQHLDLSHCKNLTGEMLANVCSHTSIRCVDLSNGMELEDAPTVEIFRHNYSIQTLTVLGCRQISFYLPFILQCKALHTLHVSDIPLTSVFEILTQCPALTTFSASVEAEQSIYISHQELTTLISLIQNIKVLNLYCADSFYWQDTHLERLIQGAPKLCALFAGRTHRRPPEAIRETLQDVDRFTKECATRNMQCAEQDHQLHTLLVEDINTWELQHILQCCPQLFGLTIHRSSLLVADTQNLLATIGNSNIRVLTITCCEKLKSADFLFLHNMLSLKLSDSVELELSDLMQFLSQNATLRVLSLTGCKNLNQAAVFHIVKKCLALEELEFDNTLTSYSSPVNIYDTTRIVEHIKKLYPALKLSLQLRN